MATTMQSSSRAEYKHTPNLQLPLKKGKVGMMAVKPLKMLVPLIYKEKGLWSIDGKVTVFGNGIIVDEKGNYKIMMVPTMITTHPDDVIYVEVDGQVYIQMEYEVGDVVYSHEAEFTSNYIYDIFDMYILQGKIPFYMTDIDLLTLMGNVKQYTGANLLANSLPMEIILSLMAFNKDGKPYRNHGGELHFAGMKEITTVSNNLAKISGSYFKRGVTGAIAQGSDGKTSNLEEVVRG